MRKVLVIKLISKIDNCSNSYTCVKDFRATILYLGRIGLFNGQVKLST
jgi:hypothetical protein